ncbi:MAG: ATP-binding protein, partial [Bacteroidota bacterium]
MRNIRSPFKFLDAFKLADRAEFFGRDTEIEQLYDLVFKSPLILVYGASGTGKTSLIQCGLASRFDGTDWLPLWVRRNMDINRSMDLTMNEALAKYEVSPESPIEKIQQLYQYYLRPVFLIFDQFEELFIFGTQDERTLFLGRIKTILEIELPCSMIIVIREEYLGQLYPFEKEISALFDFRLRVEPMDVAHVKTVLKQSFAKFNIQVETPESDRIEQIIESVSQSKSGIELPYLQIYLDQLYREHFNKTYSSETPTKNSQGHWLPLELSADKIETFGTIEEVLEKFLGEQVEEIQSSLSVKNATVKKDTVHLILDAFVSDEGTKRPILYSRKNDSISLSPSIQKFFPPISNDLLNFCLLALEDTRLIRSDSNSLELAHDSLASLIDKRRTDEQRQRNEVKRQIRSMYQNFSHTKEYLTTKQITVFEDFLPELNLNAELTNFFKESQNHRIQERNKELEIEKARSRKNRNIAIIAFLSFILAAILGIWAFEKKEEADIARQSSDDSLKKYLKAQKAKEMTEFKSTLENVNGILKGNNCPPKKVIQLIDSVKLKYPS